MKAKKRTALLGRDIFDNMPDCSTVSNILDD